MTLTGTGANLFVAQRSGNMVSVALNPNTVQAAANDTYTATLPIQSGTETANVTLTLIKGSSITLTLSQGTLSLVAPSGSTTPLSQQVTIIPSPQVPISFTTSVSYGTATGNWLSVNPAAGNLPATGGAISIIANPSNLTAGSYSGTVTVNGGGTSAQVTVSLVVGSGSGTLTLSTGAMSFAYNSGSGIVPAAQSLSVYAPVQTFVSAEATPTTGAGWLAVTGGGYTLGAGQSAYLQVSVNPVSLTTGTYNGYITVKADGVTQGYVQVTLNVNTNTGVSVSATTLTFNSPSGSNAQTVTVSYSGTQTGLTYTATPGSTGWLSVSPTSGAVNGFFYVSVNPTGLIAGTYTGYITVSVPGVTFSQTISVSLVVGGGGSGVVFGVGPTSLTFNAQSGTLVNYPQPVAVYGPSNQYFTATATTLSGVQWLVLNTTTGVTPGTLSVSVNPAAAGVGTHAGTIQVNSPSGSALVNVTLNVQASPVLLANPGGIVINYDSSSGSGSFAGQSVYLSSSAPNTTQFTYTATSGTSWLMSGIFGGTAGSTDSTDPRLLIVPTLTSLSPGVNSGSVTVTGTARNGGAQTTTVIPVTVVVTGTARAASPSRPRR